MLGIQGGKEAAKDGQRELSRVEKAPNHQLLPLAQRNGLKSDETWKY